MNVPGQRSGYSGATGWTVRRSDPDEDEIFITRTDQPWDPPNLLEYGCRVSLPGVECK